MSTHRSLHLKLRWFGAFHGKLWLFAGMSLWLLSSQLACNPINETIKLSTPETSGSVEKGIIVFPVTDIYKSRLSTFQLYNSGGKAVYVTKLEFTGKDADKFNVPTPPLLPLTLTPGKGQGHDLVIEFYADKSGTYEANLAVTFTSQSDESIVGVSEIQLRAEAKAKSAPGLLVTEPNNNQIDFGELTTRDNLTKEILIYTEGDQPITISKIAFEGKGKDVFAVVPAMPLPFQVHPGKENAKTIFVRAMSANAGDFEANLVIGAQDATNIPKAGKALYALKAKFVTYKQPGSLSVSPYNWNLVGVPLGESREATFNIHARGEIPVIISKLFLTDENQKAFQIVDPPAMPHTIKPNTTLSLRLRYNADVDENAFNTLSIEYTGDYKHLAKRTRQVRLQHQAARAFLRVDCTILDFLTAEPNSSVARTCRIRNVGNIDLKVHSIKYQPIIGAQDAFRVYGSTSFSLRPNVSHTMTFYYGPKGYTLEDRGTFVFDTNVKLEEGDSKPKIEVRGQPRGRLIELHADRKSCQDDSDCSLLSSQLSCSYAAKLTTKVCRRTASSEGPLLLVPHTAKGESTKQRFFIHNAGSRAITVQKIALKDPNGPFRLEFEESELYKTLPLNARIAVTLVYTSQGDSTPPTNEIIVTSDAQNTPSASLHIQTLPAP